MVADLGKSALMRTARLMNSLRKRSQKNGDKSAVAMLKKGDKKLARGSSQCRSNARQLGCEFHDMDAAEVFIDFAEELKHTETNPTCDQFTKG